MGGFPPRGILFALLYFSYVEAFAQTLSYDYIQKHLPRQGSNLHEALLHYAQKKDIDTLTKILPTFLDNTDAYTVNTSTRIPMWSLMHSEGEKVIAAFDKDERGLYLIKTSSERLEAFAEILPKLKQGDYDPDLINKFLQRHRYSPEGLLVEKTRALFYFKDQRYDIAERYLEQLLERKDLDPGDTLFLKLKFILSKKRFAHLMKDVEQEVVAKKQLEKLFDAFPGENISFKRFRITRESGQVDKKEEFTELLNKTKLISEFDREIVLKKLSAVPVTEEYIEALLEDFFSAQKDLELRAMHKLLAFGPNLKKLTQNIEFRPMTKKRLDYFLMKAWEPAVLKLIGAPNKLQSTSEYMALKEDRLIFGSRHVGITAHSFDTDVSKILHEDLDFLPEFFNTSTEATATYFYHKSDFPEKGVVGKLNNEGKLELPFPHSHHFQSYHSPNGLHTLLNIEFKEDGETTQKLILTSYPKVEVPLPLKNNKIRLVGASISNDGQQLVVATKEKEALSLTLHKLQKDKKGFEKPIVLPLEKDLATPLQFSFSPNGETLLVSGANGTMALDMREHKKLRWHTCSGESGAYKGQFFPDGKRYVIYQAYFPEVALKVFNTQNGKLHQSIELPYLFPFTTTGLLAHGEYIYFLNGVFEIYRLRVNPENILTNVEFIPRVTP